MSSEKRGAVFQAKAEDPDMAQAIARAADSFKYLWRELTWEYRRIVPALELAAIKAAFKDPDGDLESVEHMWLSNVEFDGELITATLLNSPNRLTSVSEGDQVELSREQLEDWMYAIEGRVYGGFTVQVLRAQMSRAERRQHDRAWGFTFAEPSRVDLVPNWQAKGKKRRWLFGGSEPPPGDADAEHPMSENMARDLIEQVGRDREAWFALGREGLNTLHSLALGGSLACVRALLEAGADPHVKTKRGKTARDLATMMGWPRVADVLRDAEALTRS